ncbi:hypothetical protein [Aureimonas leprariae]|uniref:Uncharacterized protein n=1 Tax=Plantimonas leprariae TaxID=2615207 RepID=A0A7V7TY78_9HYPH|nr:hypothetical protein [Aureimonas leprariae]KAB0682075.1 hypothetical protein F6X38_04555 [Aureimonas leprariae]
MSDNPATENPNDKMPAGKPLEHDEIVSDDDDQSVEDRAPGDGTTASEAPELTDDDNDLVNVGKFTDPAADA